MTTCHGEYCKEDQNLEWLSQALQTTSLPPDVETDCGPWCSAMVYLDQDIPLIKFAFPGYSTGLALVYDANPAVWGRV